MSFIAIFSLVGVALGVATLIVVLSVMGGFRQQLLGRIIGKEWFAPGMKVPTETESRR